jgi:hypothetical protein
MATLDGEVVARTPVSVPEGGEATVHLEIPPPPGDDAPALAVAHRDPPPAGIDDGGSVFASPWLWLSVALVAAGGAVLAIWLASGPEDPVPGTLQPAVVEF